MSFGPNLEAETEVKVQFSGEELYGKVCCCSAAVGGWGPKAGTPSILLLYLVVATLNIYPWGVWYVWYLVGGVCFLL